MAAITSFRDPAGFCVAWSDRILRVVAPECVAQVEGFLHSECGRKALAAGTLIGTRLLSKIEVVECLKDSEFAQALKGRPVGAIFEHERIEFPSFPPEWSAEMLHAAGELTLDLAGEALRSGYSLKDAAPHNVLFRGTKPVFVDVLSFEPRAAGQSVWTACAQFIRTFLLPLLAHKYWDASLAEIFTTRRDGLEPEELFAKCTWTQRLRPPFLTLVTLPTLLARKGEKLRPRSRTVNDDKAIFILESLLKRLRAVLRSLSPPESPLGGWPGYMDSHSYGATGFAAKSTFVQEALAEFKPRLALDVGANTGHFSRMAAGQGAAVVAIDSDPHCARESFLRSCELSLDTLPLVVNIARPTPALGWRNAECASFLERACGRFDAVLMLAIVHHLLVTERVPLNEIVDLAADLTKSLLLVEFVPREDPMFQRLLRGRDALHAQYNREGFETAFERLFEIVRAMELPGCKRRIYLFRKK